jgi:aerobic-type carbon monoxide dehydrogenase small subunit (CoxS/CutS family)
MEGRNAMSVKLLINSKPVRVPGDYADAPLLWFLREHLGLVGTRFGCGKAACGACTVQVDGVVRRSCITPCRSVAGQRVTTLEGLGRPGAWHPVQQAWIDLDVAQCGYCQSGQMMAAAALLAEIPRPTDAQIDDAMSEILCRCGTYDRIRKAIHRAANYTAAATGDQI